MTDLVGAVAVSIAAGLVMGWLARGSWAPRRRKPVVRIESSQVVSIDAAKLAKLAREYREGKP